MMTSYLGTLAYKSWKLTKIMPNSLKLLDHYILSNAPQKIRQWALKLVAGGVAQLDMQGSQQAIQSLSGDNSAFPRASKGLVTFDYQ